MSFYKNLVKKLNKENTVLLSEGGNSAEFSGWIDTGSYALNALVSGSMYGGIPNNKIVALAGEEATGKTYFALGMVDSFMKTDPEAGVNFNDTESAVTEEMMKARGIDPERLILTEPSTVQEFRTEALNLIELYSAEKKAPPLMMVLDSLGQLSTTKEIEDTAAGKETKDMSRAALLKATFRVLNLKLAKAKIPMIVTNHVYDVVGSYFPTKEMSGGCLVAGTKIRTEHELQSIENITEGTKVLTMDGSYKEVLQTHQFDDKKLLEIEFEDGTIIRCSEDHKFLINGEWIEAKNLVENDNLEVV